MTDEDGLALADSMLKLYPDDPFWLSRKQSLTAADPQLKLLIRYFDNRSEPRSH